MCFGWNSMFQCEVATHYISNLDNFEMLWHGCRTVWHPTFGSVACGWNCSFEWNCWYWCKWANTRAHESTWNWFCTIITINLYVDMYRFQCALDGTPCFTVAAHYISVADVLLATGANDSSDWLRRNDSYTRTFCTRSNIARTDTDTVITGIMKWLLFLAFHVIFIFFCYGRRCCHGLAW